MKSKITISIATLLYVALLPVTKLAGQQPQHTMRTHYSVVDLGTLGGTLSMNFPSQLEIME